MAIQDQMKKVSIQVAAFSLVAGVAVMGVAQGAAAFATANRPASSNGETCLFSQQLQSSVSVRRQYLARIEPYTVGGSYANANAIEEMYGNVKEAAYSPESEEGSATSGLFGWSGSAQQVVGLDALSADCIGCHDGAGASAIGVDLRNRPFDRRSQVGSASSDHPLGMDYNRYVGARRGYKPVFPGSNKMIFVNGKVGCLTCHDPLNPEKGHLVMSDRKSALCLTCHDK